MLRPEVALMKTEEEEGLQSLYQLSWLTLWMLDIRIKEDLCILLYWKSDSLLEKKDWKFDIKNQNIRWYPNVPLCKFKYEAIDLRNKQTFFKNSTKILLLLIQTGKRKGGGGGEEIPLFHQVL